MLLDDRIMGINPLSTETVKAKARMAFRSDLAIPEGDLYMHIFRAGGPRPHVLHVWKVPMERAEGRQVATVAAAAKAAPQLASRRTMSDFYARFAASKLSKAELRALFDEMSPSTRERDTRQEEIDDRVLQWMVSEGVMEEALFWDLRKLNGADGHKFDAFWEEMGAFLELEVGAGAHERRAAEAQDITYASKIISIPQLVRSVTERLHAKEGFELAHIPDESTVRLQFLPNRPTALASARFTGRFRMIRKVQSRCLSKEHVDSHYCLALARNCKTAVVEAKRLANAAGRPHAIKMAAGDDKCKIPYGAPGAYVSATTRDHAGGGTRGAFVEADTVPASLDHDHYKAGSLTPSVLLMGDIPEEAGDSWYDVPRVSNRPSLPRDFLWTAPPR